MLVISPDAAHSGITSLEALQIDYLNIWEGGVDTVRGWRYDIYATLKNYSIRLALSIDVEDGNGRDF